MKIINLSNKGLSYISSIQEVWLSDMKTKEFFRFPYINSENMSYSQGLNVEEFENSQGQTLTLIGDIGLREIYIDSFFPSRYYNFMPTNTWLAPRCINFIKNHRKDVLSLTVVSLENTFTMQVFIEEFEYNKKWNKDIDFSLKLKEYKGGTWKSY